jgi:TonB family protein
LNLQVDDLWIVNSNSGVVLAKVKTPYFNSAPTLAQKLKSSGECQYPRYQNKELPNNDLVVELELDVGADGGVLGSSIKKSTGISSLDERARVAISGCKFKPARKEGVAVRALGTAKFHFTSRYGRND